MPGTARDPVPGAAQRLGRWWRKRLRPIERRWRMWQLDARNRHSREPLLDPNGPVVSLTTFEPRWPRVHYTLESIGAGQVRPSRLVLWVAPSVLALGTPPALQRLLARGLEIRSCEDLGPHKKYYPSVMAFDLDRPLVTADDDVLYPADWLAELVQASMARPGLVHCHRARVIAFEPDGRLAPYARWPACRSTAPSPLHFSVGIGGVLYPTPMLQALRAAGDGFREVCPRADDVWLKAVALRAGVDVCQVRPEDPLILDVPGMRTSGLARKNVKGGGNDRQIEATFHPADLDLLRRHAGHAS